MGKTPAAEHVDTPVAAKKKKGDRTIFGVSLNALLNKAEDFVFDVAQEALPGPEKMDKVIDLLIQWLDEQIKPSKPWLEVLSDEALDLVLRPLLRVIVQQAYDRARRAPAPGGPVTVINRTRWLQS